MTTICSDGRIVAADGLVTAGDEPMIRDHAKIAMVRDAILGFSGPKRHQQAAFDWYGKGAKPDEMPETPAGDANEWQLAAFKANEIVVWDSDCPLPTVYTEYPFAFGAGQDYALGALHAGATPYDAVVIACRCNVKTGGKISTLVVPNVIREAAE